MIRPGLAAACLLFASSVAIADTDSSMKESLHAFFARGVYSQGASAELLEVMSWPDTAGKMRWRMPTLHNHPARLSLTAEQGHGRALKRWYVPVRLNWWAQAVTTRQDLPVRSMLMPSMLDIKRVNIAGHSGLWWEQTDDLIGTRLTRHLRAGDIIYSSYIRRPKLLRRGDQVTMIAKYAGLTVTAAGKVMRSAGLGDRVPIQNIRSKQILQGMVVDASTVHVIAGGR